MDTARQVIRWALPGWVMYLFLLIFIAINFILPGPINHIYLRILEQVPSLLVPLGVASIPLGFLIYQFYHWAYWYLPLPALGDKKLIDPIDRGRTILSSIESKLDIEALYGYDLIDAEETPFKKVWWIFYFKSISIMDKYRKNWHLSDSLWYLALTDPRYKASSEFLEKRNQMLGDIYHSLGACYQAVGAAFIIYFSIFLYVSFKETIELYNNFYTVFSDQTVLLIFEGVILRIISLSLNVSIIILMIVILQKGRKTSFEALLALKHDVITQVMLNGSFKLKNSFVPAANLSDSENT